MAITSACQTKPPPASDKDKTRATEAGFNAHLTKPADIESNERALTAEGARAET
jgi:CheY-like chemotaxis protein